MATITVKIKNKEDMKTNTFDEVDKVNISPDADMLDYTNDGISNGANEIKDMDKEHDRSIFRTSLFTLFIGLILGILCTVFMYENLWVGVTFSVITLAAIIYWIVFCLKKLK